MSQFILIVALFNYILSFYVIKSNYKKPITQSFSLFTFLIGTWVILNYFLQKTNSLLALNTIYALAPFIVLSALQFINILGGQIPNKITKATYYLSIAIASGFLVLFYSSDKMIKSITDYSHYETGSLFNIYTFFVISLLIELIGFMIWHYIKGDKKYREQIKLFAIGLFFLIAVSTTVGLVLPSLGISKYNVLDSPSSIVLVLLTTYAIMKERLMDLKTATVEIIAYFIVIVMGLILFSTQEINFVIKVFLEVLTIISAYLLIQKNKQQIFYAEKNEQLAKQLKKDKEKLIELDRMKDEFLMMTTHELITPITSIRGKLSMALDEDTAKLNTEQKKYFTPTYEAINRLNHLSQELISASLINQKKLSINPQNNNLDQLIKDVIEENKKTAEEKNNKLEYFPGYLADNIAFDNRKIKEVLENLVTNAIRFTEGGKIKIQTTKIDQKVIVSVSDNGKGIPKEAQHKLFNKFSQNERFDPLSPVEQQGAGLGLFIAKEIIELHKGKIWLESTSNKGSVFCFSLPNVTINEQNQENNSPKLSLDRSLNYS